MANSKYENQSQQLYINSEGGFGSIGDQINRWKVNLNTSPFSNQDDTILRASLTQFSMPKNFYDINENNNAIRMIWGGYTDTTTSKAVATVDTILRIPPGDYKSHTSVIEAFAALIKVEMDDAVTDLTFTVTSELPTTHRNQPYDGTNFNDEPTTTTAVDDYRFILKFACSDTDFRFDNLPIFQTLSIGDHNSVTNLYAAAISIQEYYNDSYILLGGIRVEKWEVLVPNFSGWTSQPTSQSFSVKADEHSLYVGNWFPMNTQLNTMPYIYLRSRNSRTQATSNLEEIENSHNHNIINSNLFAKIPRESKRDGSVYYELKNSPYFTNITQQQLISLEFELTDAKGRPLPQSSVGNVYSGQTSVANLVALPTGHTISREGNLFCDMVLLIEKFSFNNPSALVGFGNVPPPIDVTRFSENPNMSINNRRCG